MKKIVIVGAGFAGCAAAYFLSEQAHVTLIDEKGVGAGASGLASGLLHPYVGAEGKKSKYADEALLLAKELIAIVEKFSTVPIAKKNGILRHGPIENPGADVIKRGVEEFLITSGMTVFPRPYLEGLFSLLKTRGVEFRKEKIEDVETLNTYDAIILAVGAGIRFLKEKDFLKLRFVKGQVLTCALERPLERSISAKICTGITEHPLQCRIGGTYERDVIDDVVCEERAIAELQPKFPVLACHAGIRVTNPADTVPIIQKIGAKTWVITALGSRGLLYHAFLGKEITRCLFA